MSVRNPLMMINNGTNNMSVCNPLIMINNGTNIMSVRNLNDMGLTFCLSVTSMTWD